MIHEKIHKQLFTQACYTYYYVIFLTILFNEIVTLINIVPTYHINQYNHYDVPNTKKCPSSNDYLYIVVYHKKKYFKLSTKTDRHITTCELL